MSATELLPRSQAVYQVIERVLEGTSLRDAIKNTGLSPRTFALQLQQDREAAIAYARAQEMRADLLADEVISIADNEEDAAKARNQITARQWLASKLNTKRYGDRIDLNVTQTVDIGATLAEARARVLPARFQQDIEDAQIIDAQAENGTKPSDNKSLTGPGSDSEPDIFS